MRGRLGGLIASLMTAALMPWPARADPCPNCFAVFVMPDTQNYTEAAFQPQGGAHFDLMTRFICANRSAWTEPSTVKTMPISMVLHLGDVVQRSLRDPGWQRASGALRGGACRRN